MKKSTLCVQILDCNLSTRCYFRV